MNAPYDNWQSVGEVVCALTAKLREAFMDETKRTEAASDDIAHQLERLNATMAGSTPPPPRLISSTTEGEA